ncbi:MAG: two-component sensor histidine kinase [Burkholderiales bacterium]|nr:two-component sensor histidine kinase [Burkholderiales bacterium]
MKAAQFDRDLTLAELLRDVAGAKLDVALSKLLGPHWQLLDADDKPVRTSPAGVQVEAIAMPLKLDIDVVGKLLASDAPRATAEAAAAWLELTLAGAARYRMAADLHFEAVNADYEALQKKHAALQESETRYRELSQQLEQRVKEQVAVIERSQRQLYQSEKLASVGSLAAGMAHEINNPIGFIRSNLATALDYVKKMQAILSAYRKGDTGHANQLWKNADMDFALEDFPGLLNESATGADRVARIVANLKKYASIDCALMTQFDVNDAVRAVTDIAATQLSPQIELIFDLQPLPMIVCDQSRVNQMLLSILQNAVLAIKDAGVIKVATRQIDGDIQVSIADNGCGIAPDILSRIFDPFFTTREVGKGMGLGLTVARDIAMSHGGRIEVVSSPGTGSTFTVCLPLAQDVPSSSQTPHIT